MKKIRLLAAVAVIALSSCSNDQEVYTSEDNSQREIGFRSFIDKGTDTRATTTNEGNILNFTITGWWNARSLALGTAPLSAEYLFNAADISRREGTALTGHADWTYTPVKFWPSEGDGVYFYAYSPAATKNVTKGLYDYHPETTKIAYTVPVQSETDAQEDFLLARTGKLDNLLPSVYNSPVTMNFVHALSKARFYARTSNPNITYTISKVQLLNLYQSATIDLDADAIPTTGLLTYTTPATGHADDAVIGWTDHANQGTKKNVVIDMGSAPVYLSDKFESILGKTNALMVMPQTTTYGSNPATVGDQFFIAVTYSAFQGNFYYVKDETRLFAVTDPQSAVKTDPLNFEMGRQYDFALTFGDETGDAVAFKVTVSGWETTFTASDDPNDPDDPNNPINLPDYGTLHYFPDPLFLDFIMQKYDTDQNRYLTYAELEKITDLDNDVPVGSAEPTITLSGTAKYNGEITSLKGIELMPNLTTIPLVPYGTSPSMKLPEIPVTTTVKNAVFYGDFADYSTDLDAFEPIEHLTNLQYLDIKNAANYNKTKADALVEHLENLPLTRLDMGITQINSTTTGVFDISTLVHINHVVLDWRTTGSRYSYLKLRSGLTRGEIKYLKNGAITGTLNGEKIIIESLVLTGEGSPIFLGTLYSGDTEIMNFDSGN